MSILVENLPMRIDKEQICQLFSKYGSCSVTLSKKEAVIDFSDTQEACAAFEVLQNHQWFETKLKLTPMFFNCKKVRPKRVEKKKVLLTANKKKFGDDIVYYQNSHSLLQHKMKRSENTLLGMKAARKSCASSRGYGCIGSESDYNDEEPEANKVQSSPPAKSTENISEISNKENKFNL
jgi:hypothetical protein